MDLVNKSREVLDESRDKVGQLFEHVRNQTVNVYSHGAVTRQHDAVAFEQLDFWNAVAGPETSTNNSRNKIAQSQQCQAGVLQTRSTRRKAWVRIWRPKLAYRRVQPPTNQKNTVRKSTLFYMVTKRGNAAKQRSLGVNHEIPTGLTASGVLRYRFGSSRTHRVCATAGESSVVGRARANAA